MKKFEVEFCGGEARNVFDPVNELGIDYMLVNAENSDGENVELYAECPVVGSPFEDELANLGENDPSDIIEKFSQYAYPILKAEIIEQANENDVNPDLIDFTFYEEFYG